MSRRTKGRGRAKRSQQLSISDLQFSQFFNRGREDAGVIVNDRTAITLGVFFRCVSLIANTISSLDIIVSEQTPSGLRPIKDSRLQYLLDVEPNPQTGSTLFWQSFIGSAVARGNGYAEIVRSGPDVTELHYLDPSRVRPRIGPAGVIFYEVADPLSTGKVEPFQAEDILHVRWFPDADGITGLCPLDAAGITIGLGLALDRFASRTFKNGYFPSGFLSFPDALTKNIREQLDEQLKDWSGVENAGKPRAFGRDAKWVAIPSGVQAKDAQLVESKTANRGEVAMIFGVPPTKVGLPGTYASKEQEDLDFWKSSIQPWIVRIEEEIHRKIVPVEQRRRIAVRFNIDSLLRADATTRYARHASSLQYGWRSRNEIRSEEGLDPIPGGDICFYPENMASASEVAREQNLPFDLDEISLILDRVASKSLPVESARVLLSRVTTLLPVELDALLEPYTRPVDPAAVPASSGSPAGPSRSGDAPDPVPVSTVPDGLLRGLRVMLAATTDRLLTKEAKAAIRAAKSPESFTSWVDDFYQRHRSVCLAAYVPVCLAINGVPGLVQVEPEDLSERHCQRSRDDLIESAGQGDDLLASIEARADLWRSVRSDDFAREVIQCHP